MASDRIKLEPSWKAALEAEFDKGYMIKLRDFLKKEKQARKHIYPPGDQMFAALDLTPLNDVRVMVIGQDPYHGPGQAHGLCFSVQAGIAPPPSLVNVFQEINDDLGAGEPRLDKSRGNLTPWATQGVLLLNAVLSVERARAGSHQGQGWESFTDRIVQVVNEQCTGVVFLLWGSYAQKKGAIVDRDRHLVLQAPHPSPLSAHRGFFGCKHFSQVNAYLEAQGKSPIDWFEVA